MSVQQWAKVLFLSCFIAAPAAAFETKPGEWEVETKMGGAHAGMEMPKTKICITPEQAKKAPINMEQPKDCTTKIIENKSNLFSYVMNCAEGGEVKMTAKKIGDKEIVSDATMTTSEGGQKLVVQTTTRQKYLGPTCSKEAIQNSARP